MIDGKTLIYSIEKRTNHKKKPTSYNKFKRSVHGKCTQMLEKNYHTGELSALPLIMPLKKTKAITETRLTLINRTVLNY